MMQRDATRLSAAGGTGWAWETPVEASAAVLEIIASEQPELLQFQAQALLNGPLSFAVRELAAAFSVAPEEVAQEIGQACIHLDRLEKRRRTWRDPAEVLDSPNLAALLCVCRTRLKRVSPPTRRHRLERIQRRLEPAYELARTRAWVHAFIGPVAEKLQKAQGANR